MSEQFYKGKKLMLMRSTGLGKTELVAVIKDVKPQHKDTMDMKKLLPLFARIVYFSQYNTILGNAPTHN